jgi:AraC-like DNA-binding protein
MKRNKYDGHGPQTLTSLIDSLTNSDGVHQTTVEGVELWRLSHSVARHPTVYQPKIAIVAQGQKRGYLGDQVYRYDPNNYLVLAVPLPFECETKCSTEEPLLGVTVALDPNQLGEMLLEMDDISLPDPGAIPRGIYSTPMTSEFTDVVIRLLNCLRSPLDARMLGPWAAREIIYRVLQGEQGGALRALASRTEHFTRIARVLRRIHTDYDQPLAIEDLAHNAGMSASVFHQNFKAVTATSPLQYIKQVRLHRARVLMTQDGHNVGSAAAEVGYESVSQFGREFKRLFGISPAQDAAKLLGGVSIQATQH